MSLTHCDGLRIDSASRPAFVVASNCGRKPTWMWSAWSPIASVLSVPSYFISVMICAGFIVPCRVSSLRTVMSVIEPAPWLPRIGMPLILAMSIALPEECAETLPPVV